MFQHVLIAEDQQSISIAVKTTMKELGIDSLHTHYRYHCDDALLAMRNSVHADQPYDLLITDLSFKVEKGRKPQITGGVELIRAARAFHPGLKVLVFSVENRINIVDKLFSELGIDGYVEKGLFDVDELKKAISSIDKGTKYRPPAFRQPDKQDDHYKPTDFDIKIITLLSEGVRQKNIPAELQKINFKPSGLSSVEKRLSFLKEVLNCSQNEQLLLICRTRGYI